MKFLSFITEVARGAGKIAREESEKIRSGNHEVELSRKSSKDLVTETDKRVEDYIISRILDKFPSHDIFGEETGTTDKGSSYTWIIDPIDGTTSFVHGQPFFSVSIALYKNKLPLAGAVYAPVLDELFTAEKGAGSFLNGRKITVSSADRLIDSVLATGFACLRADLPENNLPYFNRIAPVIRGIRRYGSAALDLAYVAAGRLDGFWELNLKPYDIAAGILLVMESGGEICDFDHAEAYPENGIIATNGKITDELISCMKGTAESDR